MSAFAKNIAKYLHGITDHEKKSIRKNYKNVVDKLIDEKLIISATTDEEVVKKRFKIAEQGLFG